MAQTLNTEAEALLQLRAPGPTPCRSGVLLVRNLHFRKAPRVVQSRRSVYPRLRIPARRIRMDMFKTLAAEHIGGVPGR